MDNREYTVILNGYKRPQFLKYQIEAVKSQSHKAKEIWLYQNNCEGFDEKLCNDLVNIKSNKNLGVWTRFTVGLNVQTEFICFFDDDTIPGDNFIQNCFESFDEKSGLYGGNGVVFKTKDSYTPYINKGIYSFNEEIEQVDIVGHAWFLKTEWLPYLFLDKRKEDSLLNGEDIHLSWALQKYLKINTYVTPHPVSNKSIWSSLHAKELGMEKNAISLQSNSMNKFNDYYKYAIKNGFKILEENEL